MAQLFQFSFQRRPVTAIRFAFGANFAVTPLAVWGIGAAMSGEGSLGYSYLGASLALTPFWYE